MRLSQEALALGAGGVLALPPFYYKGVSDDGLFRFFAELIERVGDDACGCSSTTSRRWPRSASRPQLIGRLLEAYPGVIAGTKDSAGDAARIEQICTEFPQLTVFAGSEALLLDTLRWGGDGCISATVNVLAREAREVYDLFAAGEDASAAQAALTRGAALRRGLPADPGAEGDHARRGRATTCG